MPKQYACLAEVTVGAGGASTIDFTSIPSTYTDLLLKVSLRDSRSGANLNNVQVSLNGSSSGYSERLLYGNGTAASTATNSGSTYWQYQYVPSASATASIFSNWEIYIPSYTNTSINKSGYIDSATENNATNSIVALNSVLWSNTSAVNRVTLNPDGAYTFPQYSTAYLYGITKS